MTIEDVLNLAPDLIIPRALQTRSVVIMGTRGAGKTSGAVVIAEELWRLLLQFVVIDPTGVWWGLRSSLSGKSKGIPIAVMGGQHGNYPLYPDAGVFVADLVVDEHLSVVLDLSMFETDADKLRFVTAFLKQIFKRKMQAAKRTGLHIIIDEADEFAPQPGGGMSLDNEQKFAVAAVKRIVLRGRAFGLGTTLIAQRNQHLNKSVSEPCDMLLAYRSAGTRSIEAVKDWLEANEGKALVAEVMPALPKLADGECIVSSPAWLKLFLRTKIRMRRTFDSGATIDGSDVESVEPKILAEADVERIAEKMADTIERAKAADPLLLRNRIRELEREIANMVAAPAPAAPELPPATIEVPIALGEDLDRVAAGLAGYSKLADEIGKGLTAWAEQQRPVLEKIASALSSVTTSQAAVKLVLAGAHGPAPKRGSNGSGRFAPVTTPATVTVARRAPADPATRHLGGGSGATDRTSGARGTRDKLPPGEQATLTAAVQYAEYGGVDRDQLSVLTGYRRSSRDAYISRLAKQGYVTVEGRAIIATAEGTAALGDVAPLPTGNDLRAYWLEGDRLPDGERAVLTTLVASYPTAIEREAIRTATDYKRSSVDAYIARLKARRLVVIESGRVKASETLFA